MDSKVGKIVNAKNKKVSILKLFWFCKGKKT
jgi:hypothetical protein